MPDGRELVVERHGEFWVVCCGHARALHENLDVALLWAIRAEMDEVELLPVTEEAAVLGHSDYADYAAPDEFDYPAWIRSVADTLDPDPTSH